MALTFCDVPMRLIENLSEIILALRCWFRCYFPAACVIVLSTAVKDLRGEHAGFAGWLAQEQAEGALLAGSRTLVAR